MLASAGHIGKVNRFFCGQTTVDYPPSNGALVFLLVCHELHCILGLRASRSK